MTGPWYNPASMRRIQNYIGGKFADPAGGAFLDNVEPATGAVYSLVPDSDERDVQAAVDAAGSALGAWSSTPAEHRSHILLKLADLIESHLDHLAQAESIDTGKPIV